MKTTWINFRVQIVGASSFFPEEGYSKYGQRLTAHLSGDLKEDVYGLEQAKEHIEELKCRDKNDGHDEKYRNASYEIVKEVITREVVVV